MKYIFPLAVAIVLVSGQVPPPPATLNQCGKTCISSMSNDKAQTLGCTPGDYKCLCANKDFGNGLNDCSMQACGQAVHDQVAQYAASICASQQGGSGNAPAPTSNGPTVTSVAATGSAASSANSVLSSGLSSAESAQSSVSSSVSSKLSSLQSSVSTALASSSSSAASSAAKGTGSSASAFAMKTAAPLAGAGALGLAALILV